DLTGVPLADPDPAGAVRPDAPSALPLGRRLDDRRLARRGVDARDVIARERGIVDRAVRRGGDAVGPAAAGRVPHVHLAALGIEPVIDAVLAGEPQAAVSVERGGVEVDVAARRRQRERLDLARL